MNNFQQKSNIYSAKNKEKIYSFDSFKMIVSLILLLSISLTFAEDSYSKDKFSLTWNDRNDYTDFIFTTKTGLKSSFYSIFALSDDQKLGGDDLIVCKVSNGQISIERYKNDSVPGLSDSMNPSVGLEEINCFTDTDELTCFFSRQLSNPGITSHFDFSNGNKYYLIFATGNILNGKPDFNFDSVSISDSPISFVASTTSTSSSQPQEPNDFKWTKKFTAIKFGLEWDGSQNGFTKFSFYEIEQNQDLNENRYIAFGLSNDTFMGEDSVIICKWFNGTGSVEHYYNLNKSTPSLLDKNKPTIGLTDTSVSIENGVLKCKFTRQDFIQDNFKYLDLNKKHFILIARGEVRQGILQFHNSNGAMSKEQVEFKESTEKTTNAPTTPKPQMNLESVGFYTENLGASTKFLVYETVKRTIKRQVIDLSDRYIALGISLDRQIGDDCVVVCRVSNGTALIEHYYINWLNTPKLFYENKTSFGIKNLNVTIQNGGLSCSFRREDSIQGVENYYDLNKQSYYVYTLKGLGKPDFEYFVGNYEVTMEKYNFTSSDLVEIEIEKKSYDYRLDTVKKAFNNAMKYVKDFFSSLW